MPVISIIMPIYNMEDYLSDSLYSLINQSYEDFEIILVDDGSTDNSYSICEFFQSIDSRIKCLRIKNQGSGIARNKGLELATGKYVMFLDCDDYIEINMLEKMYSTLILNNVDLVICNFYEFEKDINQKKIKNFTKSYTCNNKEDCRENYIELFKKGLIQTPWNKIYKMELIKKHHINFPNLKRCQDAVFNCDYFNYIDSYTVIEDCLYTYRMNDTTISWIKYPYNYFEICLALNDKIYKSLEDWGVLTEDSKSFLATYFIRDVICCMIYSFSPLWNFNFISRINYIKYIINHESTQKNIAISTQTTLYTKLIEFFIKKRYFLFAYIFTRVQIFIKTKLFNYKLIK